MLECRVRTWNVNIEVRISRERRLMIYLGFKGFFFILNFFKSNRKKFFENMCFRNKCIFMFNLMILLNCVNVYEFIYF